MGMETRQESWVTLTVKESAKRKFDEAKRRSQYPMHVVADKAIDEFLARIEREESAAPTDTAAA